MPPNSPPTEELVRDHFYGLLPKGAKIVQVPQTTIWALEDGTLLWDWRDGYATLTPEGEQPTDAEVIQDLTKRLDASERKCLSKEKLIVKLENRVSNFGTTLQRRDATIRLLLEQIKSY